MLDNKQQRLDAIGRSKPVIAELRIEMEKPSSISGVGNYWQGQVDSIRDVVAKHIEAHSSVAEAQNYLCCGNLPRTHSQLPHQVLIDVLVRDLDYIEKYILDYSRSK